VRYDQVLAYALIHLCARVTFRLLMRLLFGWAWLPGFAMGGPVIYAVLMFSELVSDMPFIELGAVLGSLVRPSSVSVAVLPALTSVAPSDQAACAGHITTLMPALFLLASRLCFGVSIASTWNTFRFRCLGHRVRVDSVLATRDGKGARAAIRAAGALQRRWERGEYTVTVRVQQMQTKNWREGENMSGTVWLVRGLMLG
jgi:hypothetical protein